MEALAIIEAETREIIRRRGLDVRTGGLEPLIRDVAADYDQRSASGAVPPVRDLDTVVAQVAARIGGYGAIQELLDDPSVEEVWINGPDQAGSLRFDRSGHRGLMRSRAVLVRRAPRAHRALHVGSPLTTVCPSDVGPRR